MRRVAVSVLALMFISVMAFPAICAEEMKVPVGHKVGEMFPKFTLSDPVEGKSYKLDDLLKDGKETVILFMQTACTLCKSEMEMFRDNWADLESKVEMALVSVDFDSSRIKLYKESLKVPFRILHDQDASVLQSAGYSATPAMVVLDSKGKVVKTVTGYEMGEVRAYVKQTARK